ncbi:MAG: GNAT family N-acetyltransferase [Rhizobacter sp.]|nr:GNAT family N-acetyltransferase [Rhizobacter sp.]
MSPNVRAASSSSTARQLLPGDAALALFPRAAAVIDKRFANGDICLAVFSKETLAGFLWLAFGAYEEDDVRCVYRLPDPQLAWDYDVHIEPAFRMGRSLARLWDFANVTLSSRGVGWSLSRISAFNPESLAAHARLGAQRMQSATFICIGSLQMALAASWRFPSISLENGAPPDLQVAAPRASGRQ